MFVLTFGGEVLTELSGFIGNCFHSNGRRAASPASAGSLKKPAPPLTKQPGQQLF
jgi:hypothetical protein